MLFAILKSSFFDIRFRVRTSDEKDVFSTSLREIILVKLVEHHEPFIGKMFSTYQRLKDDF